MEIKVIPIYVKFICGLNAVSCDGDTLLPPDW